MYQQHLDGAIAPNARSLRCLWAESAVFKVPRNAFISRRWTLTKLPVLAGEVLKMNPGNSKALYHIPGRNVGFSN
jgi:hypothetical protein